MARPLTGVVRRVVARVDWLGPRSWTVAAGAFAILVVVLAHVGRRLFLYDLPVTDDENSVLFSARMVAHGELSVPLLRPLGAFTDLFTYVKDGRISSIDFPGGIFFRAASLVTGLDAMLYALLAGVSAIAVAAAARRLTDARGAVLAAILWLFSPMVLALSTTTHAHVVSRGFLALAIYCATRVLVPRDKERPSLAAAGLGFFTGAAFLTRPIEIGMLLAPLGVFFAWKAIRGAPGYRRYVLLAIAGLVPALVVFGWYNHETTGYIFVQARFGPGIQSAYGAPEELGLWDRIPINFAFETLMLCVWFLGPLGIALATLGVTRREPLSVVLACGVGLDLCVALAHQYTGVHVVGPIHFSETAVPLTLLAVLGARRVLVRLGELGIARAAPAFALVTTIALGYGVFDTYHARTLRAQAEAQRQPYDAIEQQGIHHAVILVGALGEFYLRDRTGSWVLQFPHPDPYFRDDIVYARRTADVAALRERFPDRAIYRMLYDPRSMSLSIDEVPGP